MIFCIFLRFLHFLKLAFQLSYLLICLKFLFLNFLFSISNFLIWIRSFVGFGNLVRKWDFTGKVDTAWDFWKMFINPGLTVMQKFWDSISAFLLTSAIFWMKLWNSKIHSIRENLQRCITTLDLFILDSRTLMCIYQYLFDL